MTATVIIIVVVAVLIFVIWPIAIYNGLVKRRVRVDNAWRQIDVQLKRRHDLIPNLVESVKGYMKYERETLERVMEARSRAVSARGIEEAGRSEGELTRILRQLFALVENYPELKANEQVAKLMEELTHTENNIAFARQFYNDMVMEYNTALQIFPNSIIASLFNFQPKPFFHMEVEEEAQPPSVDLRI
ncbi:MAG: LemA family protein [bacterium]